MTTAVAASEHTGTTAAKPLRVVQVVSHFPPDRVGGVGEVAATIHRGLLDAGYDAHVITTGVSNDDPNITRVSATPDGFPVAALRDFDLAASADVVHFHHGEAWLLLERLARLSDGPHLIVTLHVDSTRIMRANRSVSGVASRSSRLQTMVRDPLKSALDARARRLADTATFISHAGAAEIADDDTAVVIHNGVHLTPTSPAARAPSVDLLFVGTASPRKGIDLLPELLAAVRESLPATTLRIVGFDPAVEPELVARFGELGCADDVEWSGSLSSDELAPHYASARVLVVPSRYEGLPMVILEAGAHGLPAVATDVGGTGEAVIDDVTGRLVPPDDIGGLAVACHDLLTDEAGRQRLGDAMYNLVRERFTAERQVASYRSLYDEVVGR